MHSYIHVQEAHRLISKTNAVMGKKTQNETGFHHNTQCSRDYRMTTANIILWLGRLGTFKGGMGCIALFQVMNPHR